MFCAMSRSRISLESAKSDSRSIAPAPRLHSRMDQVCQPYFIFPSFFFVVRGVINPVLSFYTALSPCYNHRQRLQDVSWMWNGTFTVAKLTNSTVTANIVKERSQNWPKMSLSLRVETFVAYPLRSPKYPCMYRTSWTRR